jgi:hypothetical protein
MHVGDRIANCCWPASAAKTLRRFVARQDGRDEKLSLSLFVLRLGWNATTQVRSVPARGKIGRTLALFVQVPTHVLRLDALLFDVQDRLLDLRRNKWALASHYAPLRFWLRQSPSKPVAARAPSPTGPGRGVSTQELSPAASLARACGAGGVRGAARMAL